MTRAWTPLFRVLRNGWPVLLLWGVLFALLGQALQLVLLIVRFGDLPNYIIHYDWLASVMTIVQSTPSISDRLPIIFEEWWIEIGFMNYDYGNGISEWSLNVIPSRLVILFLLGSLLGTLVQLRRQGSCPAVSGSAAMAGASLGSLLIYATSAAMSWVVCCATPSWVVGLAMLGLSVSVSLALEDLGPALFFSGVALLSVSILLTSRSQAKRQNRLAAGEQARHDESGNCSIYPHPGT